ncbi:unnamed protein product [Adineta steineri]|uniref:Phthiocerol/phthiodiolone dimycocerosyl transferase C-terminal domain-containing protein n=2 Tax=Adineta steineri TaxID=433720 RepID=A0A813R2N1_9BILA|nr:unnamed protein product [Adineta steineri]CAF0955456.1 unnamed protein product [Adineta steineri]CAF4178692.1 unnamed protein product [Adineta steineri]
MSSDFHQDLPVNDVRQRLLSPAENALIRTSLQHQGYMRLGQVLHLQGPYISLETLTSVIGHLQHRHPFLRSRLKINPTKPDTYLMEEDETLRLKIREIPRRHDRHLDLWREEWHKHEKQIPIIGEGLAEFWLLQDPDDDETKNSSREIVLICEHSISDGLSLSTLAHELLIALSSENENIFDNSLHWPISIELAIQRSLSLWTNLVILGKFFFTIMNRRAINAQTIARVPLVNVNFSLDDMAKYSYTEFSSNSLSKEETQKLLEKCRSEGVTMTSAISSAILSAITTSISITSEQTTQLTLAFAADIRRRCIPPVPNHDLSYQVSEIITFKIGIRDVPTTLKDMWKLATTIGYHVKTSIDAGQTFVLGRYMGMFYQKNIGPINLENLPTCEISNWGVLPFREQYGKWKLEAMTPFSNMIRSPIPFVLIYTVNGVLTIVYRGSSPIIPVSTLETLCNSTIHNLQKMMEA